MLIVYLIILVLAGAFFCLAALRISSAKVDFVALGLLLWVIVEAYRVAQNLG